LEAFKVLGSNYNFWELIWSNQGLNCINIEVWWPIKDLIEEIRDQEPNCKMRANWRIDSFHLNETVRFRQNDAVSCGFKKKRKKKEREETVSFWGGTVSSSSSPGHAAGKETLFCFLLFVSSFPSHVLCHPPHDDIPKQSWSASNASIGHHSRRRGRGGNGRHMHAAIGRDRVDPAPPASINTTRMQKRRRKKEKNGRKRGGKSRERDRQCWERRNRNSRNQKPGISTERPREANEEKEEKRTERVNRSGPVSLRRGEEEPPLSLGFYSNRHRSAIENSRQHHRQLSHPRSSPQVNSLPLLSRRSLVIFLLAERALCTFCMQEEIISRLLCCAQ